MPAPEKFKKAREERRSYRLKREARLKKWVPVIESICQKNQIKMREIEGGYQFRINEYILSWWPSANKIVVQYPGDSSTIPFDTDGPTEDPKILVALKKLIRVTQGDSSSRIEKSSR